MSSQKGTSNTLARRRPATPVRRSRSRSASCKHIFFADGLRPGQFGIRFDSPPPRPHRCRSLHATHLPRYRIPRSIHAQNVTLHRLLAITIIWASLLIPTKSLRKLSRSFQCQQQLVFLFSSKFVKQEFQGKKMLKNTLMTVVIYDDQNSPDINAALIDLIFLHLVFTLNAFFELHDRFTIVGVYPF